MNRLKKDEIVQGNRTRQDQRTVVAEMASIGAIFWGAWRGRGRGCFGRWLAGVPTSKLLAAYGRFGCW